MHETSRELGEKIELTESNFTSNRMRSTRLNTVHPEARRAFVPPGSCPVTEPATVVAVDYSGPL